MPKWRKQKMTYEMLESYVCAMRKASEQIKRENPDFLVAPMLGSVPFIDTLAIVDDEFNSARVVYMPASSRIDNVNHVMESWFYNFLNDVVKSPSKFPTILGIDEVVSGQSVTRCFKMIDSASQKKRKDIRQNLVERLHSRDSESALQSLREVDLLTENEYSYEFGNIRNRLQQGIYKENPEQGKTDSKYVIDTVKTALEKKLIYKSIGIEDSKCHNRAKEYEELKSQKRIIPISVQQIITMDNPDYCPPRFEVMEGEREYTRFLPRVKDFVVTPQYLELLRSIAKFMGKDPDKIAPVNMKAILDSSKYL